ncbi:hypothetical protein [Mucilaginibacter sp.]
MKIKLSSKQIEAGAKAHALDILGQEQFKTNPEAVRSIKTDFKSAVKWTLKTIKQEGVV